MRKLLIIYYSYTGGTQQLAEAAAKAARQDDGIETILKRAEDCCAADMLDADGYIFAAPENLAAIAGVMKAFFDRCYYPLLGKIEGRPYTAIICAGSDGTNARTQLERIATGWRLRKVMDTPIICAHAQTEVEILADKSIPPPQIKIASDMGATLASGLGMGVF